MVVGVVGCGAIGALFAAGLAAGGEAEVWAYDPDAAHVAAIQAHGLRLSGAHEVVARVRATSVAEELPPCDVGLVATKGLHTRAAIAATARAFAGGAVASLHNGVGNEELIAEHVGAVMRGTTFQGGRVVAPGHVVWDTEGDTWLGPFEPAPAPAAAVAQIAEALTRAGLRTLALADARGAQWTKLIFNAAANPVAALTGLPHGRVCALPELRELVRGLVAEGVAVADALGIRLDDDPDALIDRAATTAAEHRGSMLQDVLARRATEIDFLSGGIVREGRGAGVPTPLHEAAVALVRGVEASWATS